MNGLGLPQPSPPLSQLRADLAMAEACEPIWQAHQDAKAAYAAAVEGGTMAEVRAASTVKNDAAVRLNDTRTWLRREKRISRLLGEIPALDQRLKGQILDDEGRPDATLRAELIEQLAAWRKELAELETEAQPLRELFGAQPPAPAVVVEDGSADATGLPATFRARARTGKTTGGK